ncbi:MAG: hypothetical protein KGY56_13870 [Desulfobacterales bacterium]|nr:hypothetical protein [Desulfobacterales bacterium]
MTAQPGKPRRPIWVWLISIFYLGFGLSGLMAVGMALILYSQGNISADKLPSMYSLLRSSLWGILPAANIAAAVSLFMMRKIAFSIFTGLLIVKAILQVLFETPLAEALAGQNTQMIIGYGLGYAILLAVCIYTYRLGQTGRLR